MFEKALNQVCDVLITPYLLFVVILNRMSLVPVVSRGQSCFTHPPSQMNLELNILV